MEGKSVMGERMLAGGWTYERLAAKTAEERYNVWLNAKAKDALIVFQGWPLKGVG